MYFIPVTIVLLYTFVFIVITVAVVVVSRLAFNIVSVSLHLQSVVRVGHFIIDMVFSFAFPIAYICVYVYFGWIVLLEMMRMDLYSRRTLDIYPCIYQNHEMKREQFSIYQKII